MGFFSRLFGRDDDGESDEAQRGISKEEALAAYVVREHKLGRDINEILEDPYLKNRTTDEQRHKLLDRPEVIRALGETNVEAERQRLP